MDGTPPSRPRERWSLSSEANRQRRWSLGLEVESAITLLKAGLAHLQRTDPLTEFVAPVPLVLLAQGFERLTKCLIVFEVMEREGRFPRESELPKVHDLQALLRRVLDALFDPHYLTRPAAREDFEFLTQDPLLRLIVQAMSELGDASVRYYHLNVVLGAARPGATSPEEAWSRVEREVFDQEFPNIFDQDAPEDPDEVMKPAMVASIERFARALVRLFTLSKIAPEAKIETGIIGDFLFLRDEDLGARRYLL